MSLVTINEGDLTAGGVRLSERGYSNIKSIEGQQIYDLTHKLNYPTLNHPFDQDANFQSGEDQITQTEKTASDNGASDREILATVIVLEGQQIPQHLGSMPASAGDLVSTFEGPHMKSI